MKEQRSVFWIHGASQTHFLSEYAKIAQQVVSLGNGLKENELCLKFKEWLDSDASGPWCLFIDNVDDLGTEFVGTLKRFLPVHRGTILFTSRNGNIIGSLVESGYYCSSLILNA